MTKFWSEHYKYRYYSKNSSRLFSAVPNLYRYCTPYIAWSHIHYNSAAFKLWLWFGRQDYTNITNGWRCQDFSGVSPCWYYSWSLSIKKPLLFAPIWVWELMWKKLDVAEKSGSCGDKGGKSRWPVKPSATNRHKLLDRIYLFYCPSSTPTPSTTIYIWLSQF